MDYKEVLKEKRLRETANHPVTISDNVCPVELSREYTNYAIQTLVELLSSDKENVRLAAANALLDRAHGKPGQSVTVYQGSREMKAAWDYVDGKVERLDGEKHK